MKGLVTISLKDCLDGMERVDGTSIRVMAGVTMARAAVFAASQGLSGLEFAHGIPGTIGGGVYMNAGAYGGELGSLCREVELMDREGKTHVLNHEQIDFAYRHSCLEETDWIVVSALLSLEPGKEETIRATDERSCKPSVWPLSPSIIPLPGLPLSAPREAMPPRSSTRQDSERLPGGGCRHLRKARGLCRESG